MYALLKRSDRPQDLDPSLLKVTLERGKPREPQGVPGSFIDGSKTADGVEDGSSVFKIATSRTGSSKIRLAFLAGIPMSGTRIISNCWCFGLVKLFSWCVTWATVTM